MQLDTKGIGVISSTEFIERSKELCDLQIRNEFIKGKSRVTLEDVDADAAKMILQFAHLVRRNGGVKEVFTVAMKRGPLTYDKFIPIVMHLGFDLRSFRSLFACLDTNQDGNLTMKNIAFLDRWRNKAFYERTPTQRLQRRLREHAPIPELVSLIEEKAQVNVKPANFELGHGNLLMQAVERGTEEQVEWLLQHQADPNIQDCHGIVPLHKLSQRKCGKVATSDICELLLLYFAEVDQRTTTKQTPLHLACANNQQQIVATLCAKSADVNATDEQTRTPLWFAVYRNAFRCCRCLVAAMADPCRNDRNDSTALRYSIEYGRDEMAEVLIVHLQDNFEKLFPATLTAIAKQDSFAKEAKEALQSYLNLGMVPPERVARALKEWANEGGMEQELIKKIVKVANEELRKHG